MEFDIIAKVAFDIDLTMDGNHYVVVFNTTGRDDEWNDLTKPFDTYEEAEKWLSKIKRKGD